ncbi:MAG: 1-(5-phosphoribosyl)-5-[(5-phosphoribosylamino)methylideneamino]imidazole-4-carboxamide isomerase [Clostridia bacterium]|nr:1-(5-phosphoribosyl)-5-[(5-phosphoribosylamino)methylideneamino]imidazole-4-carboxamide isomerase [Clostridia bacterium]NLS84944.1 1-(5-phosphoribosyl)-5-[(5-phosphoribosylamino)methylideneamino]imidazole-4-carboxamide isomerase [Oscillospiraceae bacterium]
MDIYPAIDLKNKQAVRLTQGDYNKVEIFGDSPAAFAKEFAEKGAKFLHVVDLDGAKDGELSNYDAIKEILSDTDMFIEVGGGIRDEKRIESYLSIGVGRVILGTAALNNFAFLLQMVKKYGDKIAVGVDAKDGFVATDGWLNVSKVDSVEFCRRVRDIGVKSVIYTDISKDGAMQGTNLEIYKTLSEIKGLDITASGGISSMSEITALKNMGTKAAIVGKAIYLGALDLSEVIKTAKL